MAFNRKTLKIILMCVSVITFLFGALFLINLQTYRVRQVFTGIELLITGEDEIEILQSINIHVDGSMHNRLFDEFPRFRGLIQIAGLPFTSATEIDVHFTNEYAFGFLMYTVAEISAFASVPRVKVLGVLHTDRNFSSFVIQVFESEPHSNGGYVSTNGNRVIVAPATDIYTALEVLRSNGVFWSEEFGVVRHQHTF